MEIIDDIVRTSKEYRTQLEEFMGSFIMKCFPFETDIEVLKQDARQRAVIKGNSWLISSTGFCAARTIERLYKVENNTRPYIDIRLSHAVYTLTDNRFIWPVRIAFNKPIDGVESIIPELGSSVLTTFLDIEEPNNQIEFIKRNVGHDILDCYRFDSYDDFNKIRFCHRFSRIESIRESILKTQWFTLNYLNNHLLNCFSNPMIVGRTEQERTLNNKMKLEILQPIYSQYKPYIIDRISFIKSELNRRNLRAETI